MAGQFREARCANGEEEALQGGMDHMVSGSPAASSTVTSLPPTKPCGRFHVENLEGGAHCGMYWEVTDQGEKQGQGPARACLKPDGGNAGQAHACKVFAYLDSVFIF